MLQSLTQDLSNWRTQENDKQQFIDLTIKALKVLSDGIDPQELHLAIAQGMEVTSAVAEVALSAEDAAWRRGPTITTDGTRWGTPLHAAFCSLRQLAYRIDVDTDEIKILLEAGGDSLRTLYANEGLSWQRSK